MRSKIISAIELKTIAARLQDEQKKVVSTTGCFDILHIGHLRFLQEARTLGDCLVVCLNSDDSVRRLKGPTRPVVPEDERAEILCGLECVDYVTVFCETTACLLLQAFQPDILVKGSDYNIERLEEASVVHAYGGEVVFLPLTMNRSTTNLISHIRANR